MNYHPPQSDLTREAYYAGAGTWAADMAKARSRSSKTAWLVAGAACLVALLEAGALVAMMPLKQVVPYTITVDRQTGYVETAQGLLPGKISQDSAVTQSFLVQYVLARESFDAADLKDSYRKIQLWSAGDARSRYLQDMAASNPQSPLKLLPPTTVVRTTIKSVSILSPSSALVRFDTERRDAGAAPVQVASYVAVLGFRYSGEPMRMQDRFVNPLGFQVTSYRRDAETVGELRPAIAAQAAP